MYVEIRCIIEAGDADAHQAFAHACAFNLAAAGLPAGLIPATEGGYRDLSTYRAKVAALAEGIPGIEPAGEVIAAYTRAPLMVGEGESATRWGTACLLRVTLRGNPLPVQALSGLLTSAYPTDEDADNPWSWPVRWLALDGYPSVGLVSGEPEGFPVRFA